jgi:hypothetical protein
MRLTRITAALALFIVSGISSAQSERSAELNKARDEWHVCIQKEVIKLDDHISPASDIATAVQMSCVREHDAMLDGMTLNAQMRDLFSQGRADLTKQVAITMVLKLRAQRR